MFVYIMVFLIFLAHTPLVVDFLQQLFPKWNIKRLTNKAISVYLIIFMFLWYFFVLFMQVYLFVPLMLQISVHPFEVALHSLFTYWLWINVVGNYSRTVLSRPGIFQPGSRKNSGNETSSNMLNSVDESNEKKSIENVPNTQPDYDKDSSHYCKVCQSDILFKDHHCPFTGNCIGEANYSYFFIGLVYKMIALAYAISVGFIYFGECFFLTWKAFGVTIEKERVEGVCKELEPYSGLAFPIMGAFMTITTTVVCHILMLLANISTYKILKNKFKVKINLKQFMEENSRLKRLLLHQRTHPIWFLLPAKNKPKKS